MSLRPNYQLGTLTRMPRKRSGKPVGERSPPRTTFGYVQIARTRLKREYELIPNMGITYGTSPHFLTIVRTASPTASCGACAWSDRGAARDGRKVPLSALAAPLRASPSPALPLPASAPAAQWDRSACR